MNQSKSDPEPDDKFISMIHNYCDKWCERCTMTEYCAIYDGEETRALANGELSEEDVLKRVGESLAEGLMLVREWAIKNGIDPDEPPTEEYLAEEAEKEQKTRENRIVQDSDEYMMKVSEWFKKSPSLYKEKEEDLNQKLRMGLPDCDPQEEADDLEDCTEIILWDHTLIRTKVDRAVSGKIEGWPEVIADMQPDYDGSAKVAILAIERSIASWMRMRDHFPDKEDEILEFLILLSRMRKALHQEFPNAMDFVRPGFDEGSGGLNAQNNFNLDLPTKYLK